MPNEELDKINLTDFQLGKLSRSARSPPPCSMRITKANREVIMARSFSDARH